MSAIALPSEVWREVFRHAIYVPRLLDTKWDYDPDDQLWCGWEFVKDTAIGTKRTIVQVCREWHALGIEFLYETIQIGHTRPVGEGQVEELAATLSLAPDSSAHSSSPTSVSGSYAQSYGWWTKRLDCHALVFQHYFPALTLLLTQFHNLSVVTIEPVQAPNDMTLRLIQIFESRFSHSLRRLDIKIHKNGSPHPDLPVIPLFSLDICVKYSLSHSGKQDSFKNISSLTLDLPSTLQSYDDSLYFPNLKHLGLLSIGLLDISTLMQFVNRHSETISSLNMQPLGTCRRLSHLINCTRNLRTLTLHDTAIMYLMTEQSSYPGITHVGLQSTTRLQYLGRCLGWLERILKERSFFPDLTLVRLLDHHDQTMSDLEWASVIGACASAGVRLQSCRGRLLVCDRTVDSDVR